MISNLELSAPFLIDAEKPWSEQTPESLPSGRDPDQRFLANSWSPDGRQVAGRRRSASQNLAGILGYSFDTKQYELLSDFGDYPAWLNDNHRLLFMNQSKVYVLDTQLKKAREVLSVAPQRLQSLGVSRDNRVIYYSLSITEADIWLMTLE
jgi:Tol biopolymer transport system component